MSREMSNNSNPNQMNIQDFQRRIDIIQAKIDRLSSGERPVDAMMYLETTAVGISEKEAMDSLNSQINHLETVFGGFDLSMTKVVGREMYVLFQMNYAIPREDFLAQAFAVEK